MSEAQRHPMLNWPPYAAHWRRASRRRYASGAERHRELVVLHALRGSAEYLIDGKAVTLSRGALLWALAGQAHVLLSDTEDFDMWVFLADRSILPETGDLPPFHAKEYPKGLSARVLGLPATQELDQIANGIAETVDAGLKAAGYAYWFARAWALWQAAPESGARRVHGAVERAVRAMQGDPDLPAPKLARAAGLSAGRLGVVFREQTGKSIAEFRAETKLARVDKIIEGGDGRGLLSAALDAGFGSYAQFYRTFQRTRGVNPRAYYR